MNNSNNETKVVDLLERDGVLSEKAETEVKQKPYTLRKLSAKDINPMLKIMKKIDIKKMKNVFNDLDMTEIMSMIKEKQIDEATEEVESEATEEVEKAETFAKIGEALIFEAIPLLLDALDNCIGEINKLLASVANTELEEVENLDLDIYFNLIYDFINKEEFAGFMKVVSKFLNSEK